MWMLVTLISFSFHQIFVIFDDYVKARKIPKIIKYSRQKNWVKNEEYPSSVCVQFILGTQKPNYLQVPDTSLSPTTHLHTTR